MLRLPLGLTRVGQSIPILKKAVQLLLEHNREYMQLQKKAKKFSVYSNIAEYKDSSFECPMELNTLAEIAHCGGYFSYVAGVASYMCEWYNVGGMHIEIIKMDLPMKKGLSSSAAI